MKRKFFSFFVSVFFSLTGIAQTYIPMPEGHGLSSGGAAGFPSDTCIDRAAVPMAAHNGYVYCYSASGRRYGAGQWAFFKIDAVTDAVSSLSSSLANNSTYNDWTNAPYRFCTVGNDIYFSCSQGLGKINTVANAVSLVYNAPDAVDYYYYSAALGRIFFTHMLDNKVCVYDIGSATAYPLLTSSNDTLRKGVQFVEYNNKVYFIAQYTVGTNSFGTLVASDGTMSGTTKLSAGSSIFQSYATYDGYNKGFTPLLLNGSILFFVSNTLSPADYRYVSVSPSFSSAVFNFSFSVGNSNTSGLSPEGSFILNNTAYLRSGSVYYQTNGITMPAVSDLPYLGIHPGIGYGINSSISTMINMNDYYYYSSAYNAVNGTELWRTDGSVSGTQIVADINTGSGSSNPTQAISLNNHIFFTANPTGSTPPQGIYMSDGDVVDLLCDTLIAISNLTAMENYLFVKAQSAAGSGIYKFGYPGIPLPLVLTSITAHNTGSSNIINWTTAVENTGGIFRLQRSRDGRTFTTVAAVQDNGRATSSYQYTDTTPYAGINYYRLYMLKSEEDTQGVFSKVVTATVAAQKNFAFTLYPNPNNGRFIIEGPASGRGSYNLSISNVLGQKVFSQTEQVNGDKLHVEIATRALVPGVYFLDIAKEGKRVAVKQFVINEE